MTAIQDIPAGVLNKIKEYAFLKYKASTVQELKAAIVDEQFEIIVNDYLGEVLLRILRKKEDETRGYIPTDEEIISYLQKMIDAGTPSEE